MAHAATGLFVFALDSPKLFGALLQEFFQSFRGRRQGRQPLNIYNDFFLIGISFTGNGDCFGSLSSKF